MTILESSGLEPHTRISGEAGTRRLRPRGQGNRKSSSRRRHGSNLYRVASDAGNGRQCRSGLRVQVIDLSILSGAHMAIVPRVLTLLRERGMPDMLIVVDGIILEDDAKQLKLLGVAAVFQPGTSLESVVEFIRAAATIPA